MGRTNIELDDVLVAEVISRYGLSSKREAVDLALRRLVGVPLTTDFLVGLQGIGYDVDASQLRSESKVDSW